MFSRKISSKRQKGIALIITMIFIVVFSALSAAMFTMTTSSVQASVNHQKSNHALNAALSGLECARYILAATETLETPRNTISDTEADIIWSNFCSNLQTKQLGGQPVGAAREFSDAGGSGDEIVTASIPYSNTNADLNFQIRFYRYDDDWRTIYIQSNGADGAITRKVGLNVQLSKDTRVLNYGIASRGRIWLAGDTTVHGSIYSAWNLSTSQLSQLSALEEQLKQQLAAGTLSSTAFYNLVSSLSLSSTNRTIIRNELLSGALSPKNAASRCIGAMSGSSVAPFNTTADSTVLGSINTCWTKDQVASKSWQFETWDTDGNPIYHTDGEGNYLYVTDSEGDFLYDNNGDKIKSRIINSDDEIQGVSADINYGEAPQNLAGMNIADYYDDSGNSLTELEYKQAAAITKSGSAVQYTGNLDTLGDTAGTKWRYEYFPHNADSYTSGSGLKVKRYIYKNQTFTDQTLPSNTNALFVDCTFNGVLYIDCNKNTSSYYNNVRFEDCAFNGVIVSNAPQSLSWQRNALYFTGSSTFNNQSDIQEATILAPNFNINLGNANNGEVQSDENVLTGAIIGGIVDVRGNAQVYGTIISMADTSSYTSGYVSNIGATLEDGGSETTTIEDIGTIEITPDPGQMLPSGIRSPIVLKQLNNTYQEIL
jgi:hypothetical protein